MCVGPRCLTKIEVAYDMYRKHALTVQLQARKDICLSDTHGTHIHFTTDRPLHEGSASSSGITFIEIPIVIFGQGYKKDNDAPHHHCGQQTEAQ